jgi:hypothetical protein
MTVTVLFLWGALSDERTGLSFVYAAGPCQRWTIWIRVLCYDRRSWYKAPIRGLRPDFYFRTEYGIVWQLRSWFRGAPSLTRGWVCLLYVPLVLASAVFLGPSPLGLEIVFYCLQFETSLFVASYDSEGHGEGIRPRLHTSKSKSKSHCDWRPVSKSWCRAPFGAYDQIFSTVWQLRSCLFCGAPSLTRGRVCLLSESLPALVSHL